MNCESCGTPTAGREEFCRRCGVYLAWERSEPDAPAPPLVPDTAWAEDLPAESAGLDLAVEPEALAVAPGETVTARVTVQNNGTQVEDFVLQAEGPGWITLAPATVQVYPSEQLTSDLQIAPPRDWATPAGTFAVRVVCSSRLHPGVAAAVSVRLAISGFRELDVGLNPLRSRGARTTIHHLLLTNNGNTPVQASVDLSDSSGTLDFRHPPLVRVDPGQRADVSIGVSGTRKLFGKQEAFPFTAEVDPRNGDLPTRLMATRVVYPWLPAWAPPVAVLLIGLATVLALLFNGTRDNAGTPQATGSTGPSGAPTVGVSDSPSGSGSGSPSGSGSAGSTTSSPPPSATQVVVPALTGQPKTDAVTKLGDLGLSVKQQLHSDRKVPAGQVISTRPKEGAPVAPGSTVVLVVSSGLPAAIDLVGQAEQAQWSDGSGTSQLTVQQGVENDACGYVALQQNLPLADGTSDPVVLETCPDSSQPGNVIRGLYRLPGPLAKGDRLRGSIGFVSGSPGKVTFALLARTSRGDEPVWEQQVDGKDQVLPVDEDLSGFAGATAVILQVTDAGNGIDDRAVWIGIRIDSEG